MDNKISTVTIAAFSILWLVLSNVATFIYYTKAPNPNFGTIVPCISSLHFVMGAFMFYMLMKTNREK
jgi:hypothetical protein